jgi:hypothetical protein
LKELDAMEGMFHVQVEDEPLSDGWLLCFAIEILDTKYEWTDVSEVIDKFKFEFITETDFRSCITARRCLIVHLVSIHKKRYTSIKIPWLRQYRLNHIWYHVYICIYSRMN